MPTLLAPASDQDSTERTANALLIWREARGLRGTAVQAYLRNRGLDLPDEAAGEADRLVRRHRRHAAATSIAQSWAVTATAA